MSGVGVWYTFLDFIRNNVTQFFSFLSYEFIDADGTKISIIGLIGSSLVIFLTFALALRVFHLIFG